MEYFIFNAESIPYQSVQEARDNFPNFIKIFADALKTQLKAMLVSEHFDTNWYNIQIAPDFFCRNWVESVDKDLGRKFKSLLANTQFLQVRLEELELSDRYDLSDFFLKDTNIKAPSLGAAYLSNQLAISVPSQACWRQTEVELRHLELTGKGNQENFAIARNFFDVSSWEKYKDKLLNERRQSLIDAGNLWENREELFPYLTLLNRDCFTKFNYSKTIYIQLWNTLEKLNKYCDEGGANFSLQNISEETNLNISDESDTVKQNPRLRQHREFNVNDKREFFGYHCKNFSGNLRLHFLPDRINRKIYIGYFGKHLPLK